ncbi:hypothetical protein Malapachy_2021 [Malassezia pachydermatis]|uniref:Non-structural maintenance of chromosomes element 1 homolog n=1 Tax=Malassezia pachydermatis TaxID=77020 RepID=A0A0M8MKX6_9BASI|nr:hypothetical protein Malapachy_2021 [Malassezia pachydermatis]KOS13618.1 hypothetical protein Malapachy_2021 [Malassezia pachydermatis]
MARETIQQALVQGLLARRFVARDDLRAIYGDLCSALQVSEAFEADLDAIQMSLSPLGLDVRTCHDQVTAVAYVALINAKGDSLAELATPYSPSELHYIRSLIGHMIHAPDARFAIPSTQALLVASHMQPTPLTKQAASDLLQNLERRGWFAYLRRTGAYTLTTRALCELDAFLRQEWEGAMYECLVCYALVTLGERCASPQCQAAVHTSCIDAFCARHTSCPQCHQ